MVTSGSTVVLHAGTIYQLWVGAEDFWPTGKRLPDNQKLHFRTRLNYTQSFFARRHTLTDFRLIFKTKDYTFEKQREKLHSRDENEIQSDERINEYTT